MNGPWMLDPARVAPDTTALAAEFPIPGYGVLPVKAHVVQAEEPVLVDTGLAALREDFMKGLRATIDPADLRWIWITHTDADHLGNLEQVLAEAPNATVVTNFIGMAKMGLLGIQPPRLHLLNPGERLDVGDRKLRAVSPVTFDAPETTGFQDEKTGVFVSADSFGALLEEPATAAAAVDPAKLRAGMQVWATIDAPWLQWADASRFGKALDGVRGMNASMILSSHLPPAQGLTDTLLENLDSARQAPVFVGPDHAAFTQMMAGAPA